MAERLLPTSKTFNVSIQIRNDWRYTVEFRSCQDTALNTKSFLTIGDIEICDWWMMRDLYKQKTYSSIYWSNMEHKTELEQ